MFCLPFHNPSFTFHHPLHSVYRCPPLLKKICLIDTRRVFLQTHVIYFLCLVNKYPDPVQHRQIPSVTSKSSSRSVSQPSRVPRTNMLCWKSDDNLLRQQYPFPSTPGYTPKQIKSMNSAMTSSIPIVSHQGDPEKLSQ